MTTEQQRDWDADEAVCENDKEKAIRSLVDPLRRVEFPGGGPAEWIKRAEGK